MKIKKIIVVVIVVAILLAGGWFVWNRYTQSQLVQGAAKQTTTTSVQFVSSTITTDGIVTAQSQAKLNFPTSGKLLYLPFKEGDLVLILLGGSSKKGQQKAIDKAKSMWQEHKASKKLATQKARK